MFPDPPPWAHELLTVGVTGTNGKTTTTTLVAAALARAAPPVVRITSLGAFLDEPGERRLAFGQDHAGFIAAMRHGRAHGARRAAIELTSEALAVGFARAWPCQIGVFTSFDHDHLDAHGSPEHYLASKAQLFSSLPDAGTAVLNAGDAATELVAEVVPAHATIVRYALADRASDPARLELAAARVTPSWNGTEIELFGRFPRLPPRMTIRAIGEPFAENALAALAAAMASGVSAEQARRGIELAPAPPGRFERVAERPWVVVDYAHTPEALRRTLLTARRLCNGRLSVVFGVGGNRDREKRRAMGAAAIGADHVIVSNDNPRREDPRQIASDLLAGLGAHPSIELELDRARAIERAVRDAAPDDLVLIAGRGQEKYQTIGDQRRPLSDADVARLAHTRR
jgi:UDP-N-acetylmuramoyl-L-alanyl-D-glutamate--2,6-diaminopimelate ligase